MMVSSCPTLIQVTSSTQSRQLGRRLALVRHRHHAHTLLPRRAREEQRKRAVAGDQADAFHATGGR